MVKALATAFNPLKAEPGSDFDGKIPRILFTVKNAFFKLSSCFFQFATRKLTISWLITHFSLTIYVSLPQEHHATVVNPHKAEPGSDFDGKIHKILFQVKTALFKLSSCFSQVATRKLANSWLTVADLGWLHLVVHCECHEMMFNPFKAMPGSDLS